MLYFIRHGQSEANLRGVFAGQRDDSLLTELGKEQAHATAQAILATGVVFDRVISSPLERTRQTATIIADAIGFDTARIEIDPRITEYDMGSLTGTPIKEISSLALTQGENAEDTELFKQRVIACVKEVEVAPGNILLISHAGVGRILEATKKGMDSHLFYDLPAWKNASVTKIDWIH